MARSDKINNQTPPQFVGGGKRNRFRRRGNHAPDISDCGFNALLVGNPNTGKTTIYNALTGFNAKVGNYPGVTVEKRIGECSLGESVINLQDVPGSYSLSARSSEEQVAINAIIGREGSEKPDLIIVVLDGLNLERNLYLALQIAEFELPMIIAVNMLDAAEKEKIHLHLDALSEALGLPVVGMAASKRRGLDVLKNAIVKVLNEPDIKRGPGFLWKPSDELDQDLQAVIAAAEKSGLELPKTESARKAFALWLYTSVGDDDELVGIPDQLRTDIDNLYHKALEDGRDPDGEIITARYAYIDRIAKSIVHRPAARAISRTDRIDGVLTHGLWGFLIFAATMTILFQALFAWADPFISAIESAVGFAESAILSLIPAGLFADFLVDGVIAGVGNVIVFLPQIILMFLFITILEDVGYMARAAFLIDGLMRRIGLNGKAFVPLLSGFACAVPAIMAVRTIEDRRSRLITMMVIPLMTCSARLPVYSVIIAAFFPASEKYGPFNIGGLILLGAYAVGAITALLAAAVIRRTILPGKTPALLIELPPYRLPTLQTIGRLTYERAAAFLRQAGTIILACTIVLWALLYFPRNPEYDHDYDAMRVEADGIEEELAVIENMQVSEKLEKSFAGRIGLALEPITRPLGFDWRVNVGLLGSLAAREVFVSTMGVIFGLSEEDSEAGLREKLANAVGPDGKKLYTPLFGLSLIIYFIYALQCFSTVAIIRRESGSWKWAAFALTYTIGLAYFASLFVYQGGKLLGFS